MTNTAILLPNPSERQGNNKSYGEAGAAESRRKWLKCKMTSLLFAIAVLVLFACFDKAEALPTITVNSKVASATEGRTIIFEIRKTGGNVATFFFSVTEQGDFFNCPVCYRYVRAYPMNSVSNWSYVTWGVITKDDSIDEANGSVTFTIVDRLGYNLGTNSSATVTVNDNDLPTISARAYNWTMEGGIIRFRIKKNSTVDRLQVFYTIFDYGDFISPNCDCKGDEDLYISASSTYSDYIQISTKDDNIDDRDGGGVYMRLLERSTYNLPANPSNIFGETYHAGGAVYDDDLATIKVTRVSSTSVTEGTNVVFKIEKSLSYRGHTVDYTVSQVGDFINPNYNHLLGDKSVRFYGSIYTTRSTNITIYTLNDAIDEVNGSFTLSLRNPQYYNVPSTYDTATVNVRDNDKPEITIGLASGQDSTVVEGGNVSFTLSSSTPTSIWSAISVGVSISQTSEDPFMAGDFLKNSSARTRTEVMTSNSKSFTLHTDDDLVREHNGAIVATIQSSSTFRRSTVHSATVKIADNDSTTLNDTKFVSISLSGPAEAKENGSVTFTLSATWDGRPATVRRSVCVDIQDGSRNYISKSGNGWKWYLYYDQYYFPPSWVYCTNFNGTSTTSFTIPLGHSAGNIDGTLTAKVYWDGRSASTTRPTVSVKVRDDDGPVISIARDASSYSESQTAGFTLTAVRGGDSRALTVKVELSETGSFLSGVGRIKDADVRYGVSTANLDVPLDDDDLPEANGSVTATITLEGTSGYVISASSGSATVTVTDNDTPLPEVSIFPVVGFAEEGSQSGFKIVLSRASASSLTVYYRLNSYTYIYGYRYRSETVGSGVQSKTFYVQTRSRSGTMSSPAILRATLRTNSSYRIASAPDNEATVKILDNTWKSVEISAGSESVTEGSPAVFSMSISSNEYLQSTPITIAYSISDPGNYISGTPVESVTLPASTRSKNVSIPTVGDSTFEASNKITVTIVPGTGYQPAASEDNRVASVIINDNDHDTQKHSIVAVYGSVVEGEPAIFEIVAPSALSSVQSVSYTIVPTFLTSSVASSGTASIPANKQRALVEFPTSSVQTNVNTGTVIAVIATDASPTYNIASVSVTKSGPMLGASPGIFTGPKISIVALADEIVEGEDAVFALASNMILTDDLLVRIVFTQSGDFVSSGLERTVRVSGTGVVLSVSTDDDGTEEADGRLAASILAGDGYVVSHASTAGVDVLDNDGADDDRSIAIARVIDSIQPVMLEELVSGVHLAFGRRSGQAFDGTAAESFSLGGKDTLQEMLQHGGGLVNSDSVSLSDFIDGSFFLIDVLPDTDGVPGTVSVWGFGEHVDLSRDGSGGKFSWKGETTSGQVGMDALVGEELLIGFASSFSESATNYSSSQTFSTDAGGYFSNTVGMHPYLGWSSPDRSIGLHGSIGYGTGEISVVQQGHAAETAATEFQMGLLSGSGLLYSSDLDQPDSIDGTIELRVRGDAWLVRQDVLDNGGLIDRMRFDDQRLFFAAEGTHKGLLSHGAAIELSVSSGIAWDKTNHGHRSGLEMVGNFKYEDPIGLDLSGSAGGTLGHAVASSNLGFSSSADFDSGRDGLDVLLTLSPRWGMSVDGNRRLRMNRELVNGDVLSAENEGLAGIGTEIGYGIGFEDAWVLTPRGGVDVSNLGTEYLLSGSLTSGSDLDFGLELTETNLSGTDTVHKVELTGEWKW